MVDSPDVVRSIKRVEIQTLEPIRAGALLRVHRIMFGRNSIQDMTVITIERPRHLHLFVEHPDLHYELDHQIDSVYGGGCRMMLVLRTRPNTPMGRAAELFMTPFVQIVLRDKPEQDLKNFAAEAMAQRA